MALTLLDAFSQAGAMAGSEIAENQNGLSLRDDTLACDMGNDYGGRLGVRISAIFVIFFGSCLGTTFPVFANRNTKLRIPQWMFFLAKFFGSGVIIATAFIHLLSPAEDGLRDPCLTGPITDYDWVSGISLMTIFVLAFIELMARRFGLFVRQRGESGVDRQTTSVRMNDASIAIFDAGKTRPRLSGGNDPGDIEQHVDWEYSHMSLSAGDYTAQMTAIFILEFGVIFHSIFIGLTLAVSGDEFNTLYIVIVFHQTFEGLGLGSRLAVSPWPKGTKWTPYILGIAYSLSTPLSIAIGLGVRSSYPPNSQTTLIVNGVFDSISAGVLIYTGLVELIAHEFTLNDSMRTAKLSIVLSAFGIMSLGAGLMALLGKWA